MSNLALGVATGVALGNSSGKDNSQCVLFIDRFDSTHATIEQMREYAGCVDEVYPHGLDVSDIKWIIVLTFIFAIAGIVRDRHMEGCYSDAVIGAVFGVCTGWGSILILWAIAFVIWG